MSKIIRNWTHEPLAKRIWSQICRKEFHACNSSLQNHAYYPLPCFLHRDVIQIDLHFPWFIWAIDDARDANRRWNPGWALISLAFPHQRTSQVTQIHRGSIENTIVQIQTPGVWRRLKERRLSGGAEKTLKPHGIFESLVLGILMTWWSKILFLCLRTPDILLKPSRGLPKSLLSPCRKPYKDLRKASFFDVNLESYAGVLKTKKKLLRLTR